MAVFGCGLLVAAVCYCVIMLAKSKHKKESKVSECSRFSTSGPTATQEEIPLQGPHHEELPVQNYPHYYTVDDIV